jgi:hypothetical protein
MTFSSEDTFTYSSISIHRYVYNLLTLCDAPTASITTQTATAYCTSCLQHHICVHQYNSHLKLLTVSYQHGKCHI